MLDFPQPLGPTIAEIPLSNFISDGSQNDLKPLIVRFFKNVTRPLPQKISEENYSPVPNLHLYSVKCTFPFPFIGKKKKFLIVSF
jgi:hypothetical protein